MKLNLTKPIVFIDIESTGLNRESDRIIELALLIIRPDGTNESSCKRFNPTIPIPEASTVIHGIKNEDVANEPTFADHAKKIYQFIKDCDIAGFNSNAFDVPMLYFEFKRAGIDWDYSTTNFIDVGNIYKIQEPRTLTASVKFYLSKEHEDAHGALADVQATFDVFTAQLNKYELPQTAEEIALHSNYGNKILDLSGKFTYNADGDVIFNFGPKRGEKALDHPDFLNWMLSKDFASDTRKICKDLYEEAYAVVYEDTDDYNDDDDFDLPY